MQLPRLRHRVVAAAVVGRASIICEILNILEGYPTRLPRLRLGGDGAPDGRGDAPRLRRPQRALGDPDFVENPVAKLTARRLCRRDPRHDRPLPRRGVGGADAGAGRRESPRRRTIRSSTRGQRGRGHLHAQRQLRHRRRSPTAPASCSTTRWTTSPRSPGRRTCYGLVQGEANAIAPRQAAALLDEPDDRPRRTASRSW